MIVFVIINPKNNLPLYLVGEKLLDADGNKYPIINGVPRIVDSENYTSNFGFQWNKFDTTQFDRDKDGLSLSRDRFVVESGWRLDDLAGRNILEVGSGAGRFSRILLECTRAHLYSIDFSDAVSANFKNNSHIAPERFHLFQASVYEMPFPDNFFDNVFCFGVLQHTPNFEASVKALIGKAKPGAEIVVDFYPIKGWWTKLHAKYVLRPLAKRIKPKRLLRLIEGNVRFFIRVAQLMNRIGFGVFTRFLPIVDLRTLPLEHLSEVQLFEWVVLDTFDMFSPTHDHPQKIEDVAAMFRNGGADVTFAGFVECTKGNYAAVVRGVKRKAVAECT